MWTKWWKLTTILTCSLCFGTMACSSPKAILPQVGPRAVPDIFLPDRPVFTPLTQEEFDKIPITAKGKILKSQTDWTGYADQADIVVQGYRSFIEDVFNSDSKGKKK